MRRALLLFLYAWALGASGAPAGFVIEAEIVPGSVYAGAEAILRLRLLRAPGIAYGVLRPPALGDAAELWPLEPIRWSEVKRMGVTWQMHERSYLIVPRRAGRLVVPGAELEGPLRNASTPGASRGPRVVLEVRPSRTEAGAAWLPARHVTLEEAWSADPAVLSTGMPVTRTLVLRAEGIPAQRLPRLEMAAQPGLRLHHDQPELLTEYHAQGTTGRLVQRIALVPLDDGETVLPELSVRWWDVQADAPRIATLPARTLRLHAAPPPPATSAQPKDSPFITWLAAAFVLVLAAGLWWHVRTQGLYEVRAQLRAACLANDARTARGALIQWWKVVSPGVPPPLLQRIGAAWDADARAELDALDAALYGGRGWNGREFWRRVRPWLRNTGARRAASRPPVAPFFRLQAPD